MRSFCEGPFAITLQKARGQTTARPRKEFPESWKVRVERKL